VGVYPDVHKLWAAGAVCVVVFPAEIQAT